MFGKKRPKTDIGELLVNYKPISLWTKVKFINVNDINGQRNNFENAEFRVTDNALLIRDKELTCIAYTLDNVIKYYYKLEDSPPSQK